MTPGHSSIDRCLMIKVSIAVLIVRTFKQSSHDSYHPGANVKPNTPVLTSFL